MVWRRVVWVVWRSFERENSCWARVVLRDYREEIWSVSYLRIETP